MSTYSNRSHNTQISTRMVGLFLGKQLGWTGERSTVNVLVSPKLGPCICLVTFQFKVAAANCLHFSSSRNNGQSRNVDFEKSEGDNTFMPKQPISLDRKAGIQLRNHYCIVNLDPFKSNRDPPTVFVGL